jgi:hypothetical protein
MNGPDSNRLATRDTPAGRPVHSDKPFDLRLAATGTIAGCGVGAVALCLIFARHAPYLAGMVIGGSALAIASVWYFAGRRQLASPANDQIARLEARINELEERLKTAETLERFEDRLAEKEANKRLKAPDSDSRNSDLSGD